MNNNNNNANALINHLEQEINWIEELNLLLAEERNILGSRQFELLEAIANKKQELSDQLEGSAKQRLDLVNQTHKIEKEFLKNFDTKQANQISQLNTQLHEKLTHCRELNTINGQVIANNIHTRQEIVDVLTNKADAVSVYTSNGNMTSKNDTNHHQEA